MQQCSRCQSFVPDGATFCPNCRSARAWWRVPLVFAGAGLASVTLSACYGPGCAVRLPDGTMSIPGATCVTYDCTLPLPDGGTPSQDPEWRENCLPWTVKTDGGDGGAGGDGGDAG